MARPQHLVLCVTNDLLADQRLHKVCTTLHQAGHRVTLVGRKRRSSPPLQPRLYRTVRLKVPWETGLLFYASFNLRLWWWLLGQRADVFTANDLDTLPAVSLAAWLRRKRLVYDAHELFTDVPELQYRPRTRAVWQWLERRFLPPVKRCITVNDALARLYHKRYGKAFGVIWNYPYRQQAPIPPRELPSTNRVILYQGVLNTCRGLELMLQAVPHLPPDVTLWIVGGGPLEADLRQQAEALYLGERVRFWGWVPFQELPAITQQAHLGLSLEDPDAGLNNYWSSPNKVFDYLQARLPVLVSDIPLAAQVVKQYQVGAVLERPQRTPQALALQITTLLADSASYQALVANAEVAAQQLCWERQETQLLGYYDT